MTDEERKALAEKTETMIARWKMGQEINRFDAWDLMQQCATALREPPIRGIDAASLPTLTDEMIQKEAARRASITSLEYVERAVFEAGAKWARALFQPAAEATCKHGGTTPHNVKRVGFARYGREEHCPGPRAIGGDVPVYEQTLCPGEDLRDCGPSGGDGR